MTIDKYTLIHIHLKLNTNPNITIHNPTAWQLAHHYTCTGDNLTIQVKKKQRQAFWYLVNSPKNQLKVSQSVAWSSGQFADLLILQQHISFIAIIWIFSVNHPVQRCLVYKLVGPRTAWLRVGLSMNHSVSNCWQCFLFRNTKIIRLGAPREVRWP